jgi:DNA-binding transcriptional MerR regulator
VGWKKDSSLKNKGKGEGDFTLRKEEIKRISFFFAEGKKVEKKIPLDKIDHTKEKLRETIGLSKEEYQKSLSQIHGETSERLLEKLGFSIEEIVKALNNSRKFSEAIQFLWRNKGRKEISLREFLETAVLLKGIRESPEIIVPSLAIEQIHQKIKELVESHGNQVWIDTDECKRWIEKNQNCKDCASEIGCLKFVMINHCLLVRVQYTPKSFEDFLSMEKWIRETVDKILKAKTVDELSKIFVP